MWQTEVCAQEIKMWAWLFRSASHCGATSQCCQRHVRMSTQARSSAIGELFKGAKRIGHAVSRPMLFEAFLEPKCVPKISGAPHPTLFPHWLINRRGTLGGCSRNETAEIGRGIKGISGEMRWAADFSSSMLGLEFCRSRGGLGRARP